MVGLCGVSRLSLGKLVEIPKVPFLGQPLILNIRFESFDTCLLDHPLFSAHFIGFIKRLELLELQPDSFKFA